LKQKGLIVDMKTFELYVKVSAITGAAAHRKQDEAGNWVWQCYIEGNTREVSGFLETARKERRGFASADAVLNAMAARGYRGMVRFSCAE